MLKKNCDLKLPVPGCQGINTLVSLQNCLQNRCFYPTISELWQCRISPSPIYHVIPPSNQYVPSFIADFSIFAAAFLLSLMVSYGLNRNFWGHPPPRKLNFSDFSFTFQHFPQVFPRFSPAFLHFSWVFAGSGVAPRGGAGGRCRASGRDFGRGGQAQQEGPTAVESGGNSLKNLI